MKHNITDLGIPAESELRGIGITGALLDRLTHHVHILEMNGESFRLKHSRQADKA
jgi:DNA replication protein DnaC